MTREWPFSHVCAACQVEIEDGTEFYAVEEPNGTFEYHPECFQEVERKKAV